VGFLAYLKKHWSKLNVTAVCGTSVGSVNAVPIAQWGAAGVDRLVDLWLALNEDGDMYEPHPTLDDAHDALRQLGMDTKNLMDLLDADGLAKLVKALGIDLADEAALAATGLGGMVFGPVVAGPFGIVFALAGLFGTAIAAGLTIERVKALGKALSTIFSCPGFNSFAPLARLIERNVDISQLGQPGRPKLRLAMVCLEDGDLYYFTETGSLLRGSADPSKATDAFWKGPLSVAKVRQAVIASSSPPIEFPAVPLQEDHGVSTRRATRNFVDGGVREVLPARAAVDLGCERMVGVMAGPLQMPAEDYDASPPPFFATTMRCVLTMLNEVTRSDAEYVRDPTQRVMTAPMTDVIDSFTVDPGLIRINIDYGHMRGFDATLGIAGKTLNLAEQLIAFMAEEEIVRLRKQIWALEHGVALPVPRTPRPGAPPIMVMVFNQGLLGSIRAKKLELLDWARMRFQACRSDLDSLPVAIAGAAGRALCIQDWWRTWERHKPGQVADTLAANSLWTRLRIGVTGPGNTIDVLEPPGSVPAAPNAPELAC
jgi:predicted acylesterase/phospholipase RssA